MQLYPTLVLDKTYRPFTIFSHIKAFILGYLEKAQVIDYYTNVSIATVNTLYPAPIVIRVDFLSQNWNRYSSPTRKAIFFRDNFTCAYCGRILKNEEATIDHIVPKSRGGKWEWENLVTACEFCNQKKGNHLLSEIGMKLLYKPYSPSTIRIEINRWKKNSEFLQVLQQYGLYPCVNV